MLLNYLKDDRRFKVQDFYNIQITKKTHFDVYNVFYRQFSRQHFSAAIATILRVILLKNTNVKLWLAVSLSLNND
jgi:hypothetical protein